MSAPAGTYFDGTPAWGSQTVTISTKTYVAENITIDFPTTNVVTKNEVGVPTRQVIVTDVATGSLTLQLPDAVTAPPALLSVVPLTPIGGGSAINFIITKVGQTFTHDNEQKVNCDIRQKLN